MVVLTKGMFTSDTSDWETPQEFFDLLNAEFQFDLDVCANSENHKAIIEGGRWILADDKEIKELGDTAARVIRG